MSDTIMKTTKHNQQARRQSHSFNSIFMVLQRIGALILVSLNRQICDSRGVLSNQQQQNTHTNWGGISAHSLQALISRLCFSFNFFFLRLIYCCGGSVYLVRGTQKKIYFFC